jgi:hypothetical protein
MTPNPTLGDTTLNLHLILLYMGTWLHLPSSLATAAPPEEEGRGAGRLRRWTTLKRTGGFKSVFSDLTPL